MASRRRYLLTYDIRQPTRLRRIHGVAKDFGYPLQYSVFVCDLDAVERLRLVARLGLEMHQGIDSVALFDLGEANGRGVEGVEYIGHRPEVPASDEPTVW